ncbi:MAG: MazG family protein, partial [Eggerthellaceae bacterium]|nr:MazG family protein [Eggerthellaceae bacterium]
MVADVVVRPHEDFDSFVATIEALRAPDGCPWDREQTHQTIAHNMIEEAYEAVDAIESGSVSHLREELGDVMLQVVLHCQIAADEGEFTIDDVCRDVNEKMIRRHPHVFGEAAAANANEVLDLWDQVKLSEGKADAGS